MIKQGLTLYSATNEWVTGKYNLESIVAKVAEAGIGPGVEVVGYQSLRGFPELTPGFADWWQNLLARYELVPTCLASNIDVALRSDRLLTDDEMTESLTRQMKVAKELGFGIVRTQIGASPVVLERVAPLAEDWGLKLGMELHAPEGPRTAAILPVRDLYERVDSPALGFIPDFSATMREIPTGLLDTLRAAGLEERFIVSLDEAWKGEGAPFERYGRWAGATEAAGAPKKAIQAAMLVFTMFGREPIESWYDIADRIVHVHGKCYGFDEAGDEPSIDYPALIGILEDIGYDGYISTEWEGHSYLGPDEADSFAEVAKQQALVRRIVGARVG
ncbi:TIM barrel protein [Demequina sp. SYSU T00192]|uniref:TIM barrel protein n=1 Tax=Demequina litoralis TaxID=3051660 RepID=A0ABT8GAC0_9MICO|nr:TIM barrel protein [Demequina sp. SYSU T00192]MDN4476084.1 TIM barrel protein [Demequina sp. SYSU T00192]